MKTYNIRETDEMGNVMLWSDDYRTFSAAKTCLFEQVTAWAADNNTNPVWMNENTVSLLGLTWEIVTES